MKIAAQSTTYLPHYTTLNRYLRYSPDTGLLYSRTDGLPFMHSEANVTGGFHPLVCKMHPLYRELGPQPWFIDLNILYSRKQYKHPICVFNIIHQLVYREPPPGPFFFYPAVGNIAIEIAKFYAKYNPDLSPTKQTYDIPGMGKALWTFDYKVQRFVFDNLMWYNPKHNKIRWRPETCHWTVSVRRGADTFSTATSAWNYHQLAFRLAQFLDYPAPAVHHLIPKAAEETNRIMSVLLRKHTQYAEHPRDPYWFAALQQHRAQAVDTTPDYDTHDNFAKWLTGASQ